MLPKPEIHKQIHDLYLAGFSQRQIIALGYGSWTVAKVCKKIARTQSEALKLRFKDRTPSLHWRTNRVYARQIWETHNGPIPEGYHIHHIDGDFRNNNILNLACLSPREHTQLHWRQGDCVREWKPCITPWHTKPERKAYMQHYNKTTRLESAVCSECGQAFMRDKYSPSSTCSHSCGTKAHWNSRRANS